MKFFCLLNGPETSDRHCYPMKFHCEAEEAGLVGHYEGGKPWQPCKADIKRHFPARWHKALDRASIWNRPDKRQSVIHLHDAKGRYLRTLYCMPAA